MKNKGFTLIEIIGVLLVIGIVTVISVPAVLAVRRSSSATALKKLHSSISTDVQRALAIRPSPNSSGANLIPSEGTNVVLYNTGTLNTTNAIGAATVDMQLQALGIIDRPYTYPFSGNPNPDANPVYYVPSGPYFRTVSGANPSSTTTHRYARTEMRPISSAANPTTAQGANFRLTPTLDGLTGTFVVYIVVQAVDARDALAIAEKFRPAWLELPEVGDALSNGAVAYGAANAQNQTNVYIYVTHF